VAGGAYSHRFCLAHVKDVAVVYTVPHGMRAVIRNCLSVNRENVAQLYSVAAADWYVVQFSVPATTGLHAFETRVVVYGGEQIVAVVRGASQTCFVSGYLFADPTMATRAPGDYDLARVEAPAPLPAA
jgi:hypothetical protein